VWLGGGELQRLALAVADAGGALETSEGGTLGIENRVVDALSLLVERLAFRERQTRA